MQRYLIKPSEEDTLKAHGEKFYTSGGTAYQRLFNRLRTLHGDRVEFAQLEETYRANSQGGIKFSPTFKGAFENNCARFETYLISVLDSLNPAALPTESDISYWVYPYRQQNDIQSVLRKTVAMKDEEFFASSQQRYENAIRMADDMIDNNERIDNAAKLFLHECVKYVRFTTQEQYFFMKPIDYLLAFKGDGSRVSNLNRLTVVLYCVYDLLSSKEMIMKIKASSVRQIVVPKEMKGKRPRYLLIRFRMESPFVSNYVCEFLLQMIERGVLRCSSLSKAFLLSPDERVFYKYCLVNGKVCLKPIAERRTVQV